MTKQRHVGAQKRRKMEGDIIRSALLFYFFTFYIIQNN